MLTRGCLDLEHNNQKAGFWATVYNPTTNLLGRFGLRDSGQRDSKGIKCLNLDQLARPDAVEHDVSLSRRDYAQGDNCASQPDLVETIIKSSADGKVITTEDFAALRSQRLRQQKHDNPHLKFGGFHLMTTCGQVAFIQALFGASFPSYTVPVPHMKALFRRGEVALSGRLAKKKVLVCGIYRVTCPDFSAAFHVYEEA